MMNRRKKKLGAPSFSPINTWVWVAEPAATSFFVTALADWTTSGVDG
jgi:hypothetical protein